MQTIKYIFFILVATAVTGIVSASEKVCQDRTHDIILMSYNTENYGKYPSQDNGREDDFRLIMEDIDPDIIVMQELYGVNDAETKMLNQVLNHDDNQYAVAFIDQVADWGSDIWHDIGLFYKDSLFSISSTTLVDIAGGYLRDALKVKLVHKPTQIEFFVFGLHLKANTSDNINDDINARTNAARNLREHLDELPDSAYFCVTGDLNILNASEMGWQFLAGDLDDTTGRVCDPLDDVGDWYSDSRFAEVHTHSTRYSSSYPDSSGLRSRFDFVLISNMIQKNNGLNYRNNSYVTYGNDGHHFGDAVNYQGNGMVSLELANALYEASDHLPVYATLRFTESDPGFASDLLISEYIEGSGYNKAIEIFNGTGSAIDLADYYLEKDVDGNNIFDNTYQYSGYLGHGEVFVLANSNASQTILDLADDTHSGVINFNGNDQIRLLRDSIEIDRVGVSGDVAFGKDVTLVRKAEINTPAPGEQDPRSNGEWLAYSQDTFTYLGFHEFDPTVSVTPAAVVDFPFELLPNYPNPFNPSTNICFVLRQRCQLKITIYDLQGRLVKTLTNRWMEPGFHQIPWKGKDKNGHPVGSGIYFYQLINQQASGQGKMVLIR